MVSADGAGSFSVTTVFAAPITLTLSRLIRYPAADFSHASLMRVLFVAPLTLKVNVVHFLSFAEVWAGRTELEMTPLVTVPAPSAVTIYVPFSLSNLRRSMETTTSSGADERFESSGVIIQPPALPVPSFRYPGCSYTLFPDHFSMPLFTRYSSVMVLNASMAPSVPAVMEPSPASVPLHSLPACFPPGATPAWFVS